MSSKIGLALSGGGQRAAAFHLGVLLKLHQLEILDKVKIISSISGGSIISAFYAFNKDNFKEFFNNFRSSLKVNIILKIFLRPHIYLKIILLIFSWVLFALIFSVTWKLIIFIIGTIILCCYFWFSIFKFSNALNEVYDKLYFRGKHLDDIPADPIFLLSATNLQTGTLMSYTNDRIFDSTYKIWYKRNPEFFIEDFPVSVAVTASSCFPPFFNPLVIYDKNIIDVDQYGENIDTGAKRIKPQLVDGGLYDNQGIYRLARKESKYFSNIIICSDASAPYNTEKYNKANPFFLLRWILDVLTRRIQTFQKRSSIFDSDHDDISQIAYISLPRSYRLCAKGFADNLITGKIRKSIIDYYEIPDELYLVAEPNIELIIKYIEEKINYKEIVKNCLSEEEIMNLSKVKTGLDGLSDDVISGLINHASVLTEIQLRMYCPDLFPKQKQLEEVR